MLHALRTSPSRLREDREAGFTLIEILVAMVLMAIVMSSLAVFFIGAQKSSSALRTRQNATVLGDEAMDHVHGLPLSKLVTNRDQSSVDAQWASLGVSVIGVDKSQTNKIADPNPAVVAGTGASYVLNGSQRVYKAGLPTVPVPTVLNGTTYSVSYILGECYLPGNGLGGDCLAVPNVAWPSKVLMDRVIVAVNWPDKGSSCPGVTKTCAYVIASLISPSGDPTFNVHQVLVDTTPPSTPTLPANPAACAAALPYKDITITLAAWSPSTDASGVARYDIYRGKTPGSLAKIASQTTTAAYTDSSGLEPSTTYYYAVVALDTVGNQSAFQVPVGTVTNPQQPFMATCATAPDTYPPTGAPSLAAVTSTTSTTTMTVGGGTDEYQPGILGYNIYRNGSSTPLNATLLPAGNFTDNGPLSPWVDYTYTAKVVDIGGNSSPAATVVIKTKDTSAPTVPSGLAAVPQPWPALQIDLNWNDSVDDVATTGYQVLRSSSNVACPSPNPLVVAPPWSLVASPSASAFSDTSGLVGSTKYYYCVYAHDAVPNNSAPAMVNATTPDKTPPTVPAGLAAPTKTPTTIGLTWAASTDTGSGVAGYFIYRNGSSTPLNASPVATTSYTDTGLTQLTSYTYTVKAIDVAGNISNASTGFVVSTTDGQAPTVPTLSTSSKTMTSVTLTWTASTDNVLVTGYAVYRNGVFVTNDPASPYTDNGLTPGTTYTYTIFAFDAAGNYSTSSNSLPVTTTADTVAPSRVTVSGSGAGLNKAAITWTASTDNVAVASYRVYVSGALAATIAFPTANVTLTGLVNGATYPVVVYAVDTSNNVSLVSTNTLSCFVNGTGTVTCT